MEEKPEPGENIKVVVRVRDLIAREKDQPKVRQAFYWLVAFPLSY